MFFGTKSGSFCHDATGQGPFLHLDRSPPWLQANESYDFSQQSPKLAELWNCGFSIVWIVGIM
jgi:hypothetical protein